MLALVRAKRVEFMEELEADDPRLLMNSEMTKWERISISVSAAEGIEYRRTAEACKYKWQTLMPDYKHIADLHKETGMNSMAYFEFTYSQRREKNLPKNFDPYVYNDMHTWLKHKSTMNPPHFRDLMHPRDGNYIPPTDENEVEHDDADAHSSQTSKLAGTLNAYANAAKYDAVLDSS
jgi:hypothetical protein